MPMRGGMEIVMNLAVAFGLVAILALSFGN
jgi:hypothetical protein